MDLKGLKRQHEEIVQIVINLDKLLTKNEVINKAFEISLELGKLCGKLSVHLTSEDKFLYPKLLNHEDIKVRNTSRRFNNEIGNIAKALETYKAKYLSAAKIKSDPEEFIRETKTIFSQLEKRVSLEEKELYPLIS